MFFGGTDYLPLKRWLGGDAVAAVLAKLKVDSLRGYDVGKWRMRTVDVVSEKRFDAFYQSLGEGEAEYNGMRFPIYSEVEERAKGNFNSKAEVRASKEQSDELRRCA